MARKQFLIRYPDRSRKNVARTERDRLLLSGLIAKSAEGIYDYIGQSHTYHKLSDLKELIAIEDDIETRHYLEGQFIVEGVDGKRLTERLQTAGAMVAQYRAQGFLATA